MFRIRCILFLVILFNVATAQQINFTFQVNGLKSPFVVMGYYQGGKAYRLDSLRVDTITGRFRWQKTGVQPGVFFCSGDNAKLFEFLVAHDGDSCFIGANMRRLDSLWALNSEENEAYFRFEQRRKFLEEQFETKKTMRNMIAQATKNDSTALKPIELELKALLDATDSLALAYVAGHPEHLYAKMLRSVRPPAPPKQLNPLLKSGKPNPAYARWQRKHYWDNTDFRDESLLRNAFWQIFFDNFFSRHVAVQPDSLIQAIDEVLALTPHNGAFYRFITLRIAQYYEQNEAPGADRIFVHMADKYLKKDDTPWLDQATLERIAYKADSNRPNLTGSMAVNFTLPDEDGKPVELYAIKAPYTLLVFYSPLCSHCMEIMPHIYQTFLDYEDKGLAAIALNSDQESKYWKKFVGQQHWRWYDVDDPKAMEQIELQYDVFNLPVIYLLDKNKIILAKKVKPNELGAILGRCFATGN